MLGLVLGPMMEEYLRRALLISLGDPMILVTSPISAGFLIAAAALRSRSRCRRSARNAKRC